MICLSKNLELFENKIIILYILDKNASALTMDQIAKFCEDFEDITYFDICSYIQLLLDSNYIKEIYDESGNILYEITDSGFSTLQELLELIPGVNLHNIKKVITKNMVKIKTDYSINTIAIPIKSDEFKVSCYIKDGNDELVNITIYASNKDQVRNISKNWNQNSEEIYDKVLSMLTIENLDE